MNRRDFLGAMGLMALSPILISKIEYWPLRFKSTKGDWGEKIEISKGPYKTQLQAGCIPDCIDCHGLCADDEATCMLAFDLEFGKHGIRKLWAYDRSHNYLLDDRRNAFAESLRRITLSDKERHEIWSYISRIRGKHNCVHDSYKTRSRYA